MAEMTDEGVLAVVAAAPARRLFACGVTYGLGALLIFLTLAQPPGLGWLIFMLVLGCAVLWLAEKLRIATQQRLLWRADGLYTGAGERLVALDDIKGIDRGALAFKPSNGFTLRLTERQQRQWAPGLWWRFGRVLGVGGTVSAGQAKFMAEQIAIALAQRDH